MLGNELWIIFSLVYLFVLIRFRDDDTINTLQLPGNQQSARRNTIIQIQRRASAQQESYEKIARTIYNDLDNDTPKSLFVEMDEHIEKEGFFIDFYNILDLKVFSKEIIFTLL